MSKMKKYDVFLSYAHEDRNSAGSISRLLQETGFVSSFVDLDSSQPSSQERIFQAVDNSFVCVLLIGRDKQAPWWQECIGNAIGEKVARSRGEFRVLSVVLNVVLDKLDAPDHLTPPFAWDYLTVPFVSEDTVYWEDSLNEGGKLHELILLIRGARRHPKFFADPELRAWTKLRAENALRIDWTKLWSQYSSRINDQVELLDSQTCARLRLSRSSKITVLEAGTSSSDKHLATLEQKGAHITRREAPALINDYRKDINTMDLMPRKKDKSKPILITGGAGFVGSNLAHRLLSAGHRVRLLDNLSRAGVERNLRWLIDTHGDLVDIDVPDVRNLSIVKQAVKDASQVFHFAAQGVVTSSLIDPIEDFEVNARGTLNLLEAVRTVENPPPFIFTSTNKVYGNLAEMEFINEGTRYVPLDASIRERGINETRPLDFHSPHGCSKGAADQYVIDYARTFRLPALVFRMSCIYGPHQYGDEDQGWVAHFISRSISGVPITIYGDGKQVRDILFVDDLVTAFLLAKKHIKRLAGNVFNIGGGPANTISLLELLDLLIEAHGRDVSVRFENWRSTDQRYYVSDTGKFSAMTGWQPRVGVHDGIRRLYEWIRSQDSHIPADLGRMTDGVPVTNASVSALEKDTWHYVN
jgi:nucleoside-diphosphate-sugar epimerase